jgi:hypothetical protein
MFIFVIGWFTTGWNLVELNHIFAFDNTLGFCFWFFVSSAYLGRHFRFDFRNLWGITTLFLLGYRFFLTTIFSLLSLTTFWLTSFIFFWFIRLCWIIIILFHIFLNFFFHLFPYYFPFIFHFIFIALFYLYFLTLSFYLFFWLLLTHNQIIKYSISNPYMIITLSINFHIWYIYQKNPITESDFWSSLHQLSTCFSFISADLVVQIYFEQVSLPYFISHYLVIN